VAVGDWRNPSGSGDFTVKGKLAFHGDSCRSWRDFGFRLSGCFSVFLRNL
jgi:hypothetical protein